jgi:hypothetical protein
MKHFITQSKIKEALKTADLSSVEESFLDARLEMLRRVQNPDGGWGYFPGKQSWLEPTVWAALALQGDPAADRAWTLLESWQRPDGGWRPAGDVQIASWGTALCVTLAVARGEHGEAARKGVAWLLDSAGVESNFKNRTEAKLKLFNPERNLDLKAWPWKPGSSAWVEPTAHTLVALKRFGPSKELRERIAMGEAQLLDVQCRDGGWNYGSRAALGVDLPSYPETTALALLGLQGHARLEKSLELARKMADDTASPMARAWLTVALRLHGVAPPQSVATVKADVLITAVEALGSADGHYLFLKTGGQT